MFERGFRRHHSILTQDSPNRKTLPAAALFEPVTSYYSAWIGFGMERIAISASQRACSIASNLRLPCGPIGREETSAQYGSSVPIDQKQLAFLAQGRVLTLDAVPSPATAILTRSRVPASLVAADRSVLRSCWSIDWCVVGQEAPVLEGESVR